MKERTSADITIYGIGGQSIATVPITAASKRVVKLMESDYIQLSFTLSEAVAFPIGSYCDDELFGRFYVTEEQMPRYNTSNGGYDYELKMDAWYWMWNLKQCMLIRNLPSDGNNVISSDSNNILVKNEHAVYAIPQLGQRVRVTHAALADGHKDTRIIGMELSLDKPYDTPKLTIGETEAYSRLKQIEKEITKLN